MATYYYDSVNGNDANPGTEAEPKKLYTSVGTSVGDKFYFKRGTTQNFAGMVTARSGSSDTTRSYFGVYGESDIPYVTFTAAADAIIMNGAGSRYITFEDIKFDMSRSGLLHSVYCASQGANQTLSNTFRRCIFTGANNGALDGGTGLSIYAEASATAALPTDYLIEDCQFHDNAEHGTILIATNSVVRRSQFWGNGFKIITGGHGFSARSLYKAASSGWTNPGGKVWKHTMAAPATDAWYVRTNVTAYLRLTRNSATPTTPAAGEYGVDDGALYINVNSSSDPSTQAITYVYARCSNLTVEDCVSYDNISDARIAGTEGHGFVWDDYSDTSRFLRNTAYGNEGHGFVINKGDANRFESNLAYDNGGCGAFINVADGAQILHNTFRDNNTNLTHGQNAEIMASFGSSNGVITNNILKGTNTYGINNDPANVGFSGATNCIHGFLTADRTGFVTGTEAVDPQLDSNHRPQAAACKRTGSYLGGKDHNNKHFYNPPNIGAIDDVTTTARPLRAVRRG